MSEADQVAVAGIGLFLPGFAGVRAWLSGVSDPAHGSPTGELIDKRSRRRTSLLTRALADVYGEALAGAAVAPAQVSSVFGSALGEAGTMIGLLDQMWRERTPLSPMRFVTSVHNTASGLISIAGHNQGFTTSLGADYDTPAMALIEALGLVLARNEVVVVACGDEAAPDHLVPRDVGGWELLAAAVVLTPVPQTASPLALLRGPFCGTPTLPGALVDQHLARNPDMGLFDLVDAVARGHAGVLRLDRGSGSGLCVALEPSPR